MLVVHFQCKNISLELGELFEQGAEGLIPNADFTLGVTTDEVAFEEKESPYQASLAFFLGLLFNVENAVA